MKVRTLLGRPLLKKKFTGLKYVEPKKGEHFLGIRKKESDLSQVAEFLIDREQTILTTHRGGVIWNPKR